MSTTQPSHLQISRRATFGGVALTAGLAATLGACRWGPPDEIAPDDDKRDADEALLGAVRRQVAARGTLAEQTAAAHVGLATALTPVIELHRAHAKALGTSVPATGAASSTSAPSTPASAPSDAAGSTGPLVVPPDANAALAQVRAQEAALQAELAGAAGQAASGPLARTIASMAAAVAMHLATLPTPRGSAVAQ